MNWNRFFYGPIVAARPFLLIKSLLSILAFDCWINLLPQAGRYSIGGFNTAHFAILDRWIAEPTPRLYGAVIMLTGVLSLASVIGRVHRFTIALITLLFTFAWTMSLLDSSPLHYLVSLILFCFCFWKPTTASELSRPQGNVRMESCWPYVLFTVSLAIAYAYAAAWRLYFRIADPTSLRLIAPPTKIDSLLGVLKRIGLGSENVTNILPYILIALLTLSAAGYFFASPRDRDGSTRLSFIWPWLALAPISVHVFAYKMDLHLGWSLAYACAFALVTFLPARTVDELSRWFSGPLRSLSARVDRTVLSLPETQSNLLTLLAGVVAAVLSLVVGWTLGLPGSFITGAIVALVIAALTLRQWIGDAPWWRGWIVSLGLAIVVLGGTAAVGTTRFDYYRFSAVDHSQRGEYETALELYEKANRYAPAGEDRKAQEERVRRLLNAQRKN
ncbi:MAG: hypothetical protein R3A47_10985 [Polyangiales bacterium]